MKELAATVRLVLPLAIVAGVFACGRDITSPPPVTPQLQILPSLGGPEAYASGISSDGSVVVGSSLDNLLRERAYRWTAAAGIEDLGTLGGDHAVGNAVTPDGGVVVGTSMIDAFTWMAYRWSAATGMEPLGTLGGGYSEAFGISIDGVVVGVSSRTGGTQGAFRWTPAVSIEELGVTGWSAAQSISADGQTVVGGWQPSFEVLAFRWSSTSGVLQLGRPALWMSSQALATSRDGSVTVGSADPPQGGRRAVRWTTAGMQQLGTIGGRTEQATAVSPEGDVIVGYSSTPGGPFVAFRWTESGGMEDLNEIFAEEVGEEWALLGAFAVSSRGRQIAGLARSRTTPNIFRGFVLYTGAR